MTQRKYQKEYDEYLLIITKNPVSYRTFAHRVVAKNARNTKKHQEDLKRLDLKWGGILYIDTDWKQRKSVLETNFINETLKQQVHPLPKKSIRENILSYLWIK